MNPQWIPGQGRRREKQRDEGRRSKERRENKRLRGTWDGEGKLETAGLCAWERGNHGILQMQSERSGRRGEGRMEKAAVLLHCAESIWNSRRLSCGSMASHATLSCYLCWCWTAVPAEACKLGLWHLLSALSLSALWLIRRVSLSFGLSTESFDTFKLAFRVIAHTQTHDNVKYLACHICV